MAGVTPLLVDFAPRADRPVHAEEVGEGQHDLLGRRGHQIDTVTGGPVQLHQLERLGVHDRLHRLEHRLADDLADLGPVPSLGQGQHRLTDADEPLLVGAEVEVDQWEMAARATIRRLMSPPLRKGRPNAAMDVRLITVLSRSKKAASIPLMVRVTGPPP